MSAHGLLVLQMATRAYGTVQNRAFLEASTNTLKIAGKAAATRCLFDGVTGTIEATKACRKGESTAKESAVDVGKRCFAGAVSTGIGVIATTAFAALTGPLSIPVSFLLGSGAASISRFALACLFGEAPRPR